MPVKDADPAAKGLDDAFAGAMSSPAKPKEPASPPAIDPEAPHGRDEAGQPLAPHGFNKDGSVRKSAAGRKPRDEDRPRIATTAQAAAGADTPAAAVGKDYTGSLADFAESAWFGLSAVGKGGSAVPLVGKYIRPRERQFAAQAAVFQQMSPKLVAAVNQAAQHNARARAFAEKIETGDVSWMLTCGFLVMPFITMSAAVWKGDEALARVGEDLTVDKLARINDKKFDEHMNAIGAAMEAAAQAAAMEAAAQAAAMMQAADAQNGAGDPDAMLTAMMAAGMEGPV